MRKFAFAFLLLSCLVARTQTNPPTIADLERMKLELEVERAKLEVDRARFETEKAKWEAQRGAASNTTITIITNVPVPVYLATEAIRLYRRGQIAGDLPAGASVSVTPHEKQRGWVRLTWQGQSYEADGACLIRADLRLADAESGTAAVRERYEAAQKRMNELQARRTDLERQVSALEMNRRQTTVIVAPQPTTSTNRPAPVVVYANDTTSSQISYLRSELRTVERELKELDKQMPALVQARDRAEAMLARVRQQIDAARSQSPQ